MTGDWEETTVGALVKRGVLERPLDGNHGSIHPKGDDFVAAGVPFIMASDLVGGGIDTVNCSFISTEQAKSLRKGFAKRGDVLISHKATLGRTALVGEIPGDFVMLTPQVTYYRPKDATKLNNRYLKYYFDSEQFQQVLQSWAGAGSTRAYIGITDQLRLPVLLPPIDEQKAIAAVLGALDDKIELNRRMNATLEAMARALFQSWFVDFDPVRRNKEEGGRTKDEISALFPDSFQESPLGLIPKGWAVGRVAHVSDFSRSSINPGNFPDETFDHYSLPAFDEGRTPKAELGSAIMSNKLVVTRNSVLLSKLNPHIPRIWLPDLHATRRSVCSTEFIVASMRPGYSREFLFSLFTSAAFASTYGTLVTGTTGSHQRIRPESVLEIKTVIPPPKMVEAFTTIAKPMFDQINRNIDQSHTLATLRDTLLPKLLSGELSVADMKKNLP
jgi:type I restriction enzyme S subunit